MKRLALNVCIVIPMYNEEKIAEYSLETILSYTRKLPGDVTVLVVNDGSEDSTEGMVKRIQCKMHGNNLQQISHSKNRGYGAALKTGIDVAVKNNYDYVLFMDSDLTNHPKYLQIFYEKMLDGYDYIKATRYAKGSDTVGVPLGHRLLSSGGNWLAKLLYRIPLTDLTNGFRAVKVDILKEMDLNECGFSLIMEELYHARYLAKTFCNVPYVLTSRSDGQGKSKFTYGPKTYIQYLKYPVRSFKESLMFNMLGMVKKLLSKINISILSKW